MKRITILVLFILLLLSSAYAGFDVNAWGGYSDVAMTDVNSGMGTLIDDYLVLARLFDPYAYESKTPLADGYIIGLDMGYSPIHGLSIGPRAEYIGIGEAQSKIILPSYSTAYTLSYGGNMISIMGGGSYMLDLPRLHASIGAAVYGGYGFANAFADLTQPGAPDQDTRMGGGSFAADFSGKLNVNISEMLSVGFQFGYRIANVTQMKYTETTGAGNPNKIGNTVKDPNNSNSDLQFDYSGVIFSGNIGLSF